VKLALSRNERAQKAPLRVAVADGQLERARDAFSGRRSRLPGAARTAPDAKAPESVQQRRAHAQLALLKSQLFPQYAQQRHNLESEKWGR